MKYNDVNWAKAWRGLALFLLRDGYFAYQDLFPWAKDNKFPLRMVSDVIEALELEPFECDGKGYYRLSGKVVPLLPNAFRDASIYRQASSSTGGNAA
jgi:hypothetical protein